MKEKDLIRKFGGIYDDLIKEYPSEAKVKGWIREEVERKNKEHLTQIRNTIKELARWRNCLIDSGLVKKL